MFNYTIIIRQLNSSGAEGIYETFHTTDEQAGRRFLADTMAELSKTDGFPLIKTIGGLVPVISQVFKTEIY